MKISKYILPILAISSTAIFAQGAFANATPLDQNFTNKMTNLEEVFSQDIYVTKQQAKEMQLNKVRTFNVYSSINTEQVSNTIAKMIDRDQPTYFSVDLYSSNIGKSDTIEYVAKVTEYN
ncbi:hypothetical protein VIN01S_30710 [Vibrio inusitatus NBRC 102082]|uniref:DUF3316 domain-containing protein n=1 Tax=Vibrio inusitatus NBRC 102082 TaxID=1219070 RepID=A0A4Y3HYS7_9VIBR|nr:hypothetical protein [Vibrio inusitatus]GEA52267.1 hypothetical protein VIN01S_30710 [Vibrio inusitatus NBRC 102082]